MKPSTKKKSASDLYYPWWQTLLVHHYQAFWLSFHRLRKEPIASFMIITIIAIALALSASLLLLLDKIQTFSAAWQQQSQLTLYLKNNLNENQIQRLQQQLRMDPIIAEVTQITPQQGLEELQQRIGLTQLNEFLTTNPLPTVFVVTPVLSQQNTQAMQSLQQQFAALPEVELVQLDNEWLQRWYTLLTILDKSTIILASIFAIGVILAVGNAVRITTERYREQIDLLQSLGATRRYIQRPFVYTGTFYGIGGAVLAWLMLQLVIICLRDPINQFAQSYNPNWQLAMIGLDTLGLLMLVGLGLGWCGSLISLKRYLA